MSFLDESYWGGYTEHGELLHLAVESAGQYARSACGLLLTGGAWVIPDQMHSARCRSCSRIEATEERAEIEAAATGSGLP
jgi:hypothetical protein